MWLFDTVALSETRKLRPNLGFMSWFERVADADIHTSVLCLGEIRRGVHMLAPGPRRDAFLAWLDRELPGWLGSRALPVDSKVAQVWGRLGGRGKVEAVDALIGCTAAAHNLTVVTRNTRHFDGLGVPVLNPWT